MWTDALVQCSSNSDSVHHHAARLTHPGGLRLSLVTASPQTTSAPLSAITAPHPRDHATMRPRPSASPHPCRATTPSRIHRGPDRRARLRFKFYPCEEGGHRRWPLLSGQSRPRGPVRSCAVVYGCGGHWYTTANHIPLHPAPFHKRKHYHHRHHRHQRYALIPTTTITVSCSNSSPLLASLLASLLPCPSLLPRFPPLQWVMCCGIWLVSVIVQFALGNPQFEPFAMLGGWLWCTGES